LRTSRLKRRKCLTLSQKRTSRMRSKNGGDGGTGVYMRERTTSRVTEADRTCSKFYDIYSIIPGNFGSTHLHFTPCCAGTDYPFLMFLLFEVRRANYSFRLETWLFRIPSFYSDCSLQAWSAIG